jgi:hypothetical protein
MKITATAVLLLLIAATALAEPLPVPKPTGPGGSCPFGYTSSGSYCVPSQGAQDAVVKPPNGTCPWGWTSSGSFACAAAAAPGEAKMGTVFVAEVQGADGLPFEDQAKAAIEAENAEEARDFLVPAVMAMNRKLHAAGAERWDEANPILTREATEPEIIAWRRRKALQLPNRPSPVVWLIDLATE